MAFSNPPSLLIFGPHTKSPPTNVLQELRQEINDSARLSVLRDAVNDLPRFWKALVDLEPELMQVPATSFLNQLCHWFKYGDTLPYDQSDPPNHYGLAVTVLLQISQYSRFLDQLGENSHEKVLKGVQSGGVQGFCAGFLSAIAIASAATGADLGATAAVALRLAVCIGAYVDQDSIYSPREEKYACVAILWKEASSDSRNEVARLIDAFPNVS